jgi:hypothetical protein
MLILATASSAALALSWDVVVGSSSVVLLVASFLGGVVGAFAMVCFFSFASNSHAIYTVALSAGVGSNGFGRHLILMP